MTPEQIEMYKNMDAGARFVDIDDPELITLPFIDRGDERVVLTDGLKIKLTEEFYYFLGSDKHPLTIKYLSEEPVDEQESFKDICKQMDEWLSIPGVVKGVINL